jgi:hypothetical protein
MWNEVLQIRPIKKIVYKLAIVSPILNVPSKIPLIFHRSQLPFTFRMFSFMQSLHSFDQRFEIRLIKQTCWWLDRIGRGSRAGETRGARGALALKDFASCTRPSISFCPLRFSNLPPGLRSRWLWGHSNCFWGSRAGRTEGVRGARAPQDFGSIRSKTFSLKFPFIFLCPAWFSDLLPALGSRFWGHLCRFWVGALRFISFRSQLDF